MKEKTDLQDLIERLLKAKIEFHISYSEACCHQSDNEYHVLVVLKNDCEGNPEIFQMHCFGEDGTFYPE